MMIKPSINELDKVVDNRYSLVCAVAKRARELAEGADQLVICGSDKEVTIAANELCCGKMRILAEGEVPVDEAEVLSEAEAEADEVLSEVEDDGSEETEEDA